MSLSYASHSIRQTFNARDELPHLWCFFIDVLQSTPLISKSLPIHIAPNGNLILLSQIVRNPKITEVLEMAVAPLHFPYSSQVGWSEQKKGQSSEEIRLCPFG